MRQHLASRKLPTNNDAACNNVRPDTNEVHTKCGSCNCNGKCNNNNCSDDGCNNCCKWQPTAPAVAECGRQLFSMLRTYPVK